jgi:FAD/FMN-containing dehydrogenase
MTDLFQRPAAMAGFRGQVLMPDDPGYDDARRVFNGMVDRRPDRIMRCADTFDVITAVHTARELTMPLSVYGGGHGVTGSAVVEGGVCIDLRLMDQVTVDPEARTAKVAAGATWAQVDAATQAHGLAVTGGRVSTTGVGGLALGSGSGWLERRFGFTCDNLVSAKVVTAAGKLVLASERENPDLFWGLRGGGGNFGIVTEFTFSLHDLGPIVLGGMQLYPADMARDLVRFWRDFMVTAPDEVGTGLAFITAPPIDLVPEPVRGQPVIGLLVCYAGPVEEGQRVLAPLLEFGPPAVKAVQPMPYVAVQKLIDEGNPKGMRNYWSAGFLAELPDEAVDALVSVATQPVSPLAQVILVPGGGAIARVSEQATAFGQRSAPFNLHVLSMWPDPADDAVNIDQTRRVAAAVQPWGTGRTYLNFIGEEGRSRVEAAYGPDTFARLQQLKRVWDPDNVFCHNQNIPPGRIPTQR